MITSTEEKLTRRVSEKTIDLKKMWKRIFQWSGALPYVGLVLVIVIFGLASDGILFSQYNIKSIIAQVTPVAIIAMGAVFIYSLGNMDVSIGTSIGVVGLVSCVTLNATGSLIIAVIAGIVTAVTFSFINSIISGALGILPILASVCTMMIGRGLLTIITTKAGGSGISAMYDVSMFKQPVVQISVIVCLAVVLAYLFKFTVIGKNARSVGGNAECARQNGINPLKTQIISYMILGLAIGIAAMFVWSNTGNITRSSGMGYEMDVMIALILGGMSLNGGMHSRFSSAIVGSLTYIILRNGLLLSSFLSYNQVDMAKAIIFIVMVVITSREKGNLLPK